MKPRSKWERSKTHSRNNRRPLDSYIDGKQFRFGYNYVLFSDDPSHTVVLEHPPTVAHAKPPRSEVWGDDKLSLEVFERTVKEAQPDGVKRLLRLDKKIQQRIRGNQMGAQEQVRRRVAKRIHQFPCDSRIRSMLILNCPQLSATLAGGGVGQDHRGGAKTGEPFTPQTPDPDKAPQPPRQPFANKPKPILVPKPKASFQWPPDCLWPFAETIGHHKWDGDA